MLAAARLLLALSEDHPSWKTGAQRKRSRGQSAGQDVAVEVDGGAAACVASVEVRLRVRTLVPVHRDRDAVEELPAGRSHRRARNGCGDVSRGWFRLGSRVRSIDPKEAGTRRDESRAHER